MSRLYHSASCDRKDYLLVAPGALAGIRDYLRHVVNLTSWNYLTASKQSYWTIFHLNNNAPKFGPMDS